MPKCDFNKVAKQSKQSKKELVKALKIVRKLVIRVM